MFDYYPDRSSPILVVKGQRSRSPGTKNALRAANTHPGAYEWYALAASRMPQQRAAAADERISWRPRGDVGGGVQIEIRNWTLGSVGSLGGRIGGGGVD